MRFYGVHSGRNNIARYLARSYMWNNKVNKTTINNNKMYTDEELCNGISIMFIFAIILLSVALS